MRDTLPLDELAQADAVYAYSFIVTNLDVATPTNAAEVEHWYRHRAAPPTLRLPSGEPGLDVGALLAVNLAGWLHQLTATPLPDGHLAGHGVRDGQAIIETLRHKLIRVPARLVRHAGTLTLRLPPATTSRTPS